MYKDKIYDIAVNTFEITCYMFPLEEWEVEEKESEISLKSSMRSIVGFHGAAKGEMIISPSDELLIAMTENMLGIEGPDENQKAGALCEVANIICGNTVPLFAQNDNICYIQPPRILKEGEGSYRLSKNGNEERVQVLLDEGIAEVTVSYIIEEEL